MQNTEYSVPRTKYSISATRIHVIFLLAVLHAAISAAGQDASQPLSTPALSAAEMLERFGVDQSQQDAFFDGQALTPSEDDVLAKILYHVPRLGRDNLFRWRQASLRYAEIEASPDEQRFQVYRIQGRAKRVTKHSLLPEQAQLYEYSHYYRVTLAVDGTQHPAVIAVRHVPDAWQVNAAIDESAAADALFLKTGAADSGQSELFFAAERVGWYPDRLDSEHNIGPADLALAKAGFDIGLWDDVRSSKEHALAAADREAFYQLLWVLGKSQAGLQIGAGGDTPVNVVELLAESAQHQGGFFQVEGVARRVLRVPVSDADVRTRFGIDHYYEIDLFLPLNGPSLRLGKPGEKADGPVFENEFPATLIVRELPAGLDEGENVHQLVAADAVFFKVWAYRASYTAKFGQLQPAPLFVAGKPRVVVVETDNNWITGALVLVALGFGLAVAAVILWSQWRSDKRAKRKMPNETLDFRF